MASPLSPGDPKARRPSSWSVTVMPYVPDEDRLPGDEPANGADANVHRQPSGLPARSQTVPEASAWQELTSPLAGDKVVLGVCAMAKKAQSKPMRNILSLLEKTREFTIIVFEEQTILEAPIEEWPAPIDCLISFYSDGFPLEKAQAYVALRKPHCINQVTPQKLLFDRRRVYKLLAHNGIPHPQAVTVERDPDTGELRGAAAEYFEEQDDFIIVGDTKVCKPFVEKPVDAENHNICIYYASSAGGGVKRLFRKVSDRSSSFDPHSTHIRRDASYMYEPFMKTQGTDIKVYTVGPEYAHAEARKSPVIDGKVNRDENGKELRFPVVLTPKEKEMARRICLAFGQFVCGFDLLRTSTGSYVIDVNGWSFVKGMPKYDEDAACVLRNHMLKITNRLVMIRKTPTCFRKDANDSEGDSEVADSKAPQISPRPTPPEYDRWQDEELLAVLAVMRHGDRTPKNKMKWTTRRHEFVRLHRRWVNGSARKEAKLKAPKQLQEVLDSTLALLGAAPPSPAPGAPPPEERSATLLEAPKATLLQHKAATAKSATSLFSASDGVTSAGGDSDCSPGPAREAPQALDEKETEALTLIRTVLETGGHFDGIYRKVQIKPTAWSEADEVEEVLIVLKYGGILTPAGVAQAEALGHDFRNNMYPNEETAEDSGGAHSSGLLRLHATQRHDFKVYSSDEGRVQMSAAAFTRGLLDLEKGNLTPICSALVDVDQKMLDDLPHAAQEALDEAKRVLYKHITGDAAESGKEEPKGSKATPSTPSSCSSPAAIPAMPSFDGKVVGGYPAAQLAAQGSLLWSGGAPGTLPPNIPVMMEELRELHKLVSEVGEELQMLHDSKAGISETYCRNDGLERKRSESMLPVDALAVPACCSCVHFRLVLKRWKKLKEDLWDKKKERWNISKVPEIYDAVKFDLIHHPELAEGFAPLYHLVKRLNDVMVPNEYGHDPHSRARIGAAVCGRLVHKLLVDLRNSMGTGTPPDELPELQSIMTAEQYLRERARQATAKARAGSPPTVAGEGEACEEGQPEEEDNDELEEAEFARLDQRFAADLKSPNRKVRTRLYFTSESHIQTLVNVLRYCHNFQQTSSLRRSTSIPEQAPVNEVLPCAREGHAPDGASAPSIICPEAEQRLLSEPVFDYLTQVVFRLYEDKRAEPNTPERYRVEVLFSPGATGDPTRQRARDHMVALERRQAMHKTGFPLTFEQLQKLLSPFDKASQKSSSEPSTPSNRGQGGGSTRSSVASVASAPPLTAA